MTFALGSLCLLCVLCGHDCGDFVLVNVAELLCATIRPQDHAARWGGEEFLLVLPETDAPGAVTLTECVRRIIAEYPYHYQQPTLTITMTFGVSVWDPAMSDLDVCVKQADQALYQGKMQGRIM